MRYRLIDDPLCDEEGFDTYLDCKDCPLFYDCMEEDDEDEVYEMTKTMHDSLDFGGEE